MDKILNAKTIVTHDGDYHIDEVFATSLINYIFDHNGMERPNIIRTRNEDILDEVIRDPEVIVLDVGRIFNENMLNFDHHQGSFERAWESSRIPLSSTGIVFSYLRDNNLLSHLDGSLLNELQESWIEVIDAIDNGIMSYSGFDLIYVFATKDEKAKDNSFFLAVNSMDNMFLSILNKCKEQVKTKEDSFVSYKHAKSIRLNSQEYKIVNIQGYADDNYIETLHDDVDFYITERKNGEFGIKTARLDKRDAFSQKHRIPTHIIHSFEEGNNFENIFENEGAYVDFVHKGGFFSVVHGNFDDAIDYILFVLSTK